MSSATFFDRFIFPALDWLQVESLRHLCTGISDAVRVQTGYWVHPASWGVLAGLVATLGVLLIIRNRVAQRGQSAGR